MTTRQQVPDSEVPRAVTEKLDAVLAELEAGVRGIRHRLIGEMDSWLDGLSAAAGLRQTLRSVVTEAVTQAAASAGAQRRDTFTAAVQGARRVVAAQNQAQILSAIADAAQPFAGRIVLFISRGDFLVAWETRNVESRASGSNIRSTQIPKTSETLLAEAFRSAQPIEGSLSSHRENRHLAERLGGEMPKSMFCSPIVVRGKSTAVLYADAGPAQRLHPDALQLLVDLGQNQIHLRALEARAGLKPQPAAAPEPLQAAPSEAGPATRPPTPTLADPVPVEEVDQAPAAVPPPVIEPVPAPPSVSEAPEPEPAEGITTGEVSRDEGVETQIEVGEIPLFGTDTAAREAQEAAPEEEAQQQQEMSAEATLSFVPSSVPAAADEETIEIDLDTIFSEQEAETEEESDTPQVELREKMESPAAVAEPVEQSSEPEPEPVVEAPRLARDPLPMPGAPPQPVTAAPAAEDPDRMHSDARRFAKLLVSEIKLYNEQMVVEGRKHQDLYDRLKKDIDRSRELYQERVSQSVSQRVDYFHDELVRILGANDPSTLGSDYPGPRLADAR